MKELDLTGISTIENPTGRFDINKRIEQLRGPRFTNEDPWDRYVDEKKLLT